MERNAWPYMAAIIDGEGTISTGIHTLPDGKIRAIRLHVHANNSDFRLIKWLLKNFGGRFYQDKIIDGFSVKDSHRYKWYIGEQAGQKWLLEGMLPYLVAKKKQAEIGLRFLETDGSDHTTRLSLVHQCEDLNQSFTDDRIFPIFQGKDKFVYAAGIMDGEGSFCICHCGAKGEICWRTDVSVGNTDFHLIKWLLANFGGRFYPRVNNDSEKLLYSWRLSGHANKERFILQSLPYLKLKAEAANTVLQFLRLGSERNPLLRKQLADKCTILNNSMKESVTTDTQDSSIRTEDTV